MASDNSEEGTPLLNWIQKARCSLSSEDYTASAVMVALQLTNYLCMFVENQNSPVSCTNKSRTYSSPPPHETNVDNDQPSSLPPVRIEDITAEKVIVLSDMLGVYVSDDMLANKLVHIEPGQSNLSDPSPLVQREVCFALGKIFFEIFSGGVSFHLTMDNAEFIPNDNRSCGDDEEESVVLSNYFSENLDLDSESETHRKKRIFSRRPEKFKKAKIYLELQGLPRSISHLVSDLLQAEKDYPYVSKTALLSLCELQLDLRQMNAHPHLFLRDITDPRTALRQTALFGSTEREIYGREDAMDILMEKSARVYLHAPPPRGIRANGEPGSDNFLCEVILISGVSGAGKTALLKQITSFFNANNWFVLTCKFDRQAAPLLMLVQSVDTFLARFVTQDSIQRDPEIQCALDRISLSIVSSIDRESFEQLCELLPSLSKIFPMSFGYIHDRKIRNGQSMENLFSQGGVGTGSNRLRYLFQIIFKAICSGGYPVSCVFEDLQWSNSISMEVIRDIIQPDGYNSTFSSEEDSFNRGLLVLGSFRRNECEEEMLIDQLRSEDQNSRNVNFSTIYIGALPEPAIKAMLSDMFCLPPRYTEGLAQIVIQKTRGSPIFMTEFLKFIIQNNMMTFSVKDRRWIWDEITIDLQMISQGVVEMLTNRLRHLSLDVIETLKVLSCIGQINVATIKLLDSGQFVPDMLEALESAAQEGIVERAGPIFAFTHDMLQESTLNLIPEDERLLLRKKIGKSLVEVPNTDVSNNADLCILAVDQMNLCKDTNGMLDAAERALFAQLNLDAGNHSIAASSYEQARAYFEAGISLLDSNPWCEQYSLCLELYEMSAVVSFMDGKVETVSTRLDSILSNAKSFDDTLNSRALKAKLLASQGLFVESVEEVFGVLLNFGEQFPGDVTLSHLKSEINATQSLLKDTSVDTFLNLPPITDKRKLITMNFMSILLSISFYSSPMLMALYCCRMMKLTLQFGFCDDTILSIAYASYALFHYGEDIELATRFTRIAESLINGHPNENTLRANLSNCICSITAFVEPSQALTERSLKGYNSAQIVGDVDKAMLSSLLYCLAYIYCVPDLVSARRKMIYFLHQSVKYRREAIQHNLMCLSDIFTALMGHSLDAGVEIKTSDELFHIAEKTNNSFLMQQVITAQMYLACYFRNYPSAMDLGEKYKMHMRSNMGVRRGLDVYRIFFEGISALCLARSTNEAKWREIGVESVKTISQLIECSEWNFRNKLHLLNALLLYLDNEHNSAEISFQSAIASAHNHRFYHEEALACEMYGIFLIENENIVKGIEQLQLAIDKYEQWGAMKKAADVQDLICIFP